MKHSKYQKELGSTADFTKMIMEATKGVVQKSLKGVTKYCFLFESWIDSKNAAKAAIEVGAKFIGMVNTNTKVFCK